MASEYSDHTVRHLSADGWQVFFGTLAGARKYVAELLRRNDDAILEIRVYRDAVAAEESVEERVATWQKGRGWT